MITANDRTRDALDELRAALDTIRDLERLLEAHPRGHVEMAWVGGPVTDAALAATRPAYDGHGKVTNVGFDPFAHDLPASLVERARVADGAGIVWSFVRENGDELRGHIELPALLWLQTHTSRVFLDGAALAYDVAPSAHELIACLPAEHDGDVSLYERPRALLASDEPLAPRLVAGGIALDDVWRTMIATLGIHGWEHTLDPRAVDRRRALNELVRDLWKELRAHVPDASGKAPPTPIDTQEIPIPSFAKNATVAPRPIVRPAPPPTEVTPQPDLDATALENALSAAFDSVIDENVITQPMRTPTFTPDDMADPVDITAPVGMLHVDDTLPDTLPVVPTSPNATTQLLRRPTKPRGTRTAARAKPAATKKPAARKKPAAKKRAAKKKPAAKKKAAAKKKPARAAKKRG